ncbi:hypothetical protein VMCG_10667 [Cytospora schulzeri]|uniref:Uncharacterized protein n=1 Tax=Cytospora schulzeri TaxID=448051 RepID=A0A423VAK4_9PEZI|nr:hypothetical protein VMCG_10667 [Valsa malicola]
MYHPLGANLLKAWDISHIQPDKRVASSASVEARKIKCSIAKRHLECLCRYEEKLLSRVDQDVVNAIYNQRGMPVPVPIEDRDKDKDKDKEEGGRNNGTGTLRQHDADYQTIQSARSRFHPVKEVREQAATNLMMMEMQEIEKWNKDAANWGTATAYRDIGGTTYFNEGERTDNNPAGNSNDILDTDLEWSYAKDDEEEEYQAQWVEGESTRDKEDQQITTSESEQDTDDTLSKCSTCDFLLRLPNMPPSEMSRPPTSPNPAKREPICDTVYQGTGQEEHSKTYFHATNDLVMVLDDKSILSVYLDSIEEGIKEARKNRTERKSDREKARKYCAGPIWRPRKAREQNRQQEPEERRGPAEEESSLRWFEYEKMHLYNGLSGQWELTVERRGRDYGLTRAADTETQDCTEEKTKDLSVGNQDWNTDTMPDWAGATRSGWFD